MLASAWLTAVATGVLAVFAIITAWYARKAFREQSREVNFLQQQADAQQAELQRQAEDRRRAQAIGVFVTTVLEAAIPEQAGATEGRHGSDAKTVTAIVHNTSAQPIYGVKIHWMNLDSATQAGEVDRLGTIRPGGSGQLSRPVPGDIPQERFAPIVFFRDAAAQRWTLTRMGYLAHVDSGLPDAAPVIGTKAVTQSPFWSDGSAPHHLEWMPTTLPEVPHNRGIS
jgi:hypothetical protein